MLTRWDESQWRALEQLIQNESGWQPLVYNHGGSGACGLFQSLPCSKVLSVAGTLDNVQGQAQWGLDYIQNRYGSPQAALDYWHCIGLCGNKNGVVFKTHTWY